MGFDLKKLLVDVFQPEAGELVTVACDTPHGTIADTDAWRERRAMAEEWRQAFAALGRERGFTAAPLLTYQATGANNADLPRTANLGGEEVELEAHLRRSTLLCFMTQFSATAPLSVLCESSDDLRAASLPGVAKRMEQTALSADYREVARRCRVLDELMRGAVGLAVTFSTGHSCNFDLRFRTPEMDDGFLPRGKAGDRVINLPSGETFVVPYEGEREGEPSLTSGTIPVGAGDDAVLLRVAGNRIAEVVGSSPAAAEFRELIEVDPARANIAEVAFGCNDRAVVTGIVLEDEKAGFHWAFGRSEHLGGTVGPDAFRTRATVLHQDVVYARGNPIQVARAVIARADRHVEVIRDGEYVVF
jgi:hypothetical protein